MSDAPTGMNLRYYAIGAHAAQRYGDEPYSVHLDDVVAVMHNFGFASPAYFIVGYLHDILEDTAVTPKILLELGVPEAVVKAVQFATDEDGPNRRTRKAKTYERVRRDLRSRDPDCEWQAMGLVAKWCDRIANLRRCVANKDRGLLSMYQKEAESYRSAYYPPDWVWNDNWRFVLNEYNKLVGRQ